MDEVKFTLPYRSALMAKQIYSACRLGSWCFSLQNKHLFYSTFPYEQELKLFLEIGGTLDSAIASADQGVPLILSDPMGLMWIAEVGELREHTDPMLFVLGPVFLTNISTKYIFDQMAQLHISNVVYSRYARILQEVPVLDTGSIEQYARILHSTITDDYLPTVMPMYKDTRPQPPGQPQVGGKTDYHRAHQLEQDILSSIREGRTEGFQRLSYPGVLYQFHIDDPMREIKDNIIIFTSLCARAAVEGGVSLHVAKEREEMYISQIERCTAITELAGLNNEMIQDYSSLVFQCRENPNVSATIQNCCNYIRNHYMERLELSDISSALGYADYYLSRKFHREMGIHISDYINEVRLGHAKALLATTNMSLESISEKLHYSSRSYFSKVFRKHFGLSPSEYRAGKDDFDENQRG